MKSWSEIFQTTQNKARADILIFGKLVTFQPKMIIIKMDTIMIKRTISQEYTTINIYSPITDILGYRKHSSQA